MIYLVGSLRNPKIPEIAAKLREAGHETFDDWHAAGPHADDSWMAYEKSRGHNLAQALQNYAAKHVFDFDYRHLRRASHVVLALPAGKSAHLELGWAIGQGKICHVLLDGEPDRYDVMYQFAAGVHTSLESLISALATQSTKAHVAWVETATEPTK